MSGRAELTNSDQFTLHAMFEVIAACALVFAALPYRDLILFTSVFAALAVWSIRVTNWSDRLPLMVWLGGCCLLCLGLACVEQAFAPIVSETHRANPEYLAFFGTVSATLGGISGMTGLSLLLLVIGVARWNQSP